MEKIECFKEEPFFTPVTTWSHKEESLTEVQSKWIQKKLIQEDHLPPSIKATTLNVAEFKVDGFKMLVHLLSLVGGTTVAGQMNAVRDLVSLNQDPSETSGVHMGRIHDIKQVVEQMKVADVLPLFALAHLDSSWYPSLNMRYVTNNPIITNVSIPTLEPEMVNEEGRLRDLQRYGQLPELPTGLPTAKRTGTHPSQTPRSQSRPAPSQPCLAPSQHSPPTGYPLPAPLLWK